MGPNLGDGIIRWGLVGCYVIGFALVLLPGCFAVGGVSR